MQFYLPRRVCPKRSLSRGAKSVKRAGKLVRALFRIGATLLESQDRTYLNLPVG